MSGLICLVNWPICSKICSFYNRVFINNRVCYNWVSLYLLRNHVKLSRLLSSELVDVLCIWSKKTEYFLHKVVHKMLVKLAQEEKQKMLRVVFVSMRGDMDWKYDPLHLCSVAQKFMKYLNRDQPFKTHLWQCGVNFMHEYMLPLIYKFCLYQYEYMVSDLLSFKLTLW